MLSTYKLTAEQYQRMGQADILPAEARLELIHGEIVLMSPIDLRHAVTINRLNHVLVKSLDYRAIVSIQNALRISDYSEPEPDILVLRYRDDFYANKFPTAEDVLLLIEVADSSLRYDQTTKLALYSEQGIGDYWIANLERNILEIYRQPQNGSYLKQTLIDSPQIAFAPLAFPDVTLTLTDVYGKT